VRPGFEVIEDGGEGVGGGEGAVFGEEFIGEPMAEGGRADRKDIEAAGARFVETDEGLAVSGSEGIAAAGSAKEIRQRRRGTHEVPPLSVWQGEIGRQPGEMGKLMKEREIFSGFWGECDCHDRATQAEKKKNEAREQRLGRGRTDTTRFRPPSGWDTSSATQGPTSRGRIVRSRNPIVDPRPSGAIRIAGGRACAGGRLPGSSLVDSVPNFPDRDFRGAWRGRSASRAFIRPIDVTGTSQSNLLEADSGPCHRNPSFVRVARYPLETADLLLLT
jgi:hypothetical protein